VREDDAIHHIQGQQDFFIQQCTQAVRGKGRGETGREENGSGSMAMGMGVVVIWAVRVRGERTQLIRMSGVLTGGERAVASTQKVFLIQGQDWTKQGGEVIEWAAGQDVERKQEFGALTAMAVIRGVELDVHDRLTVIEVAYTYGRGLEGRRSV